MNNSLKDYNINHGYFFNQKIYFIFYNHKIILNFWLIFINLYYKRDIKYCIKANKIRQ